MILLVSSLVSASPGIAQTYLSSFTGINGPTFVAIDSAHPAGTTWLYVSEHGAADNTGSGGGRILKYNLTASTGPTVVATAGNADGQFRSPDAIIVDSATGDLFISDRYLNRIQRITNTGAFVMKWGSSTAGAPDEMHGPVGMARDSAGAIYVSEHGDANGAGVAGNVVSKYTISGTAATRVWRNGNGFNVPYGIALAGSSLLISDGFSAQVQIWNPTSGTPTGSIALPGTIPLGLFVDSGGSVWIAESSSNGAGSIQRVEKRTATGTLQSSFGSAGTGAGQFMLPFDVAIDPATNRAYVSDYSNNRVQVWDLTPVAAAPTITSPATASANVGAAFSYQIVALNSPTSYGATNLTGTGLSLNASTGAITGTPTNIGTINSTLTATNASGTGTATLSITVSAGGDGAPPAVSSIVLANGTTSTDGAFTVTFSRAVTGATLSSFAVNTMGGTSATLTSVTQSSPTTYRVNFAYSGSSGSLQLAIKTTDSGIADSSGNPFVGHGVCASAVIPNNSGTADLILPTVTSFTAGTPVGSSVSFTLIFSEAVTGITADDFVVARGGAVTGATVGIPTGGGATWTVPVTFSGTGAGTIALTVIGGATANIRDAATNWFAGGGANVLASVNVAANGGVGAPVISSATTASATVGTAFSYQITASNSPTSYTATNLTGTGLSLNATTGAITGTPTAAGTISSNISAANAGGGGSAILTITVAEATVSSRLINLSSRLRTSGEAGRAMIAGFVVAGTGPRQMLVRAIGPSLTAFGVQGALANPRLQIYSNGGVLVAENEDWGNNTAVAAMAASVGAFPLDGTSRDAAVLLTLDPGAYTAQVVANGGTGVALIEVYDAAGASSTTTTRQLINISTRGFVDTGDGNLIAGFVVSGNAPKRLLIRGIGPSLTAFGVAGAVANPTLKLYASGSAAVLAQNDDWGTPQTINSSQPAATAAELSAAFTATGAFPLAANSRDAAIIVTLVPGAYSAVVADASNGTGAGLVEVYEISSP